MSSKRSTIFSPKSVGTVETRKSSSFFFAVGPVLDHDAAVLRQALFRDVQLGHDFQAAGDGVLQPQRRRHHRLQLAVNTEPHAHFHLVRLNVNIARASFHRVRQNQVYQLDDGRLFGGLLERRGIEFGFLGGELQLLVFIDQVFHHLAQLFRVSIRTAIEPRNRFPDGRFGRHHRLHIEAGHELDVVHGEYVRGIGHRNGQNGTHARKRNDLVTKRGVLGNQFDDVGIDFVILQIDRGNAVLAREHTGDVVIGDEAHLRQAAPQFATIRALKFERLLELVLSDQAFFNKYLAQTDGHPQHSLPVCTQGQHSKWRGGRCAEISGKF